MNSSFSKEKKILYELCMSYFLYFFFSKLELHYYDIDFTGLIKPCEMNMFLDLRNHLLFSKKKG